MEISKRFDPQSLRAMRMHIYETEDVLPDSGKPMPSRPYIVAPSGMRALKESDTATVIAKKIGAFLVAPCPHCGQRHRYRGAEFGKIVRAHCGGKGGLRLVQA